MTTLTTKPSFLWHHFLCCPRYTFCRAFLTTLNELNDYAGQHEVIAENLTSQIIAELSRYLQDLKSERKSVSHLCSLHIRCLFFWAFICILPTTSSDSPHFCPLKSNIYFRQQDIDSEKETETLADNKLSSQFPLHPLFCKSWCHRRVNIDTPKGSPEMQNVTEWVLFMEESRTLYHYRPVSLF